MTGPLGAVGGSCPCVKRHSPPVVVTEMHHVLPKSWGGSDTAPDTTGPGRNTVEVCANTHTATHACLNEYVRAKGVPAEAVLRRYPAMARRLAAVGWEHRISGHPTPYW